MIRPDPDDDTRRDRMPRGWQDDRWSQDGCGWDGWQASGWNGRPRPRMRLPRPLRMALLAILCLFALLAAVDLALTIIDPDRPMHVAQLILGPLLRLSGLFTLGM